MGCVCVTVSYVGILLAINQSLCAFKTQNCASRLDHISILFICMCVYVFQLCIHYISTDTYITSAHSLQMLIPGVVPSPCTQKHSTCLCDTRRCESGERGHSRGLRTGAAEESEAWVPTQDLPHLHLGGPRGLPGAGGQEIRQTTQGWSHLALRVTDYSQMFV